MLELTNRKRDMLCPRSESKKFGYASDGASNMTGAHQKLVTRFQSIANDGIFRIWYAAFQIDLVMQMVLLLCTMKIL